MQEPTIEMQAKLFAALSKAQGAVGAAHKWRTGQIGQQKYKYADLAAIDEAIGTALVDNGLAIVPFPGMHVSGTQGAIVYIVHEGGGWIREEASIPCKPDSQGAVSGSTYLRRTILTNILLIVTEDDDGRGAMPAPSNRPPQNQPDMGTPTTAFTPVVFPNEPRQPSLGSLTGNQIRALISNTKFPSSGIVGAYFKNDGSLGPIVDAQVEAWSSDNEGADGMALLRAAAGYASINLKGEISERAKTWLAENQS